MPIYEYQCEACGYKFEEIQKVNDVSCSVCPQCKTGKVQRLISAANFHLKGGGWYKTDYAKPASSAVPKTESNASTSKIDSNEATKSVETKVEPKTEAKDTAKNTVEKT